MRTSSTPPKPPAMRRVIVAALILSAACSDSSDPPSKSEEAGNAGGNSLLADLAGLYYLPDRIDPTTLQLNTDGTFRWKTSGCDFFFDDAGRWVAENDQLVLLPGADKERFNWPGKRVLATATRVILRWNEEREQFDAEAESNQGTYQLSWLPGGQCARCERDSEERSYACDDPF
jgi:hypothetical protein